MGVGIFGTLQIAKESLFTNQTSISVTSNNIANVNTPGYSRQSPQIETWEAQRVGGLVFGRGSRVADITKSYDQFINNSIISEKSVLGWWESKESSMSQIETIFNESTGVGVNKLLNDFWNSWHDVADSPELLAERGNLQADGQTLSSKFNKMLVDLKNVQNNANNQIPNTVEEINILTKEIANLNNRILGQESSGGNANSMTDERSLKTEELSQLIGLQVLVQNNNQYTILTVTGQALVVDNESWELKAQIDPENSNYYSIKHIQDGIERDLTNKTTSGKLKGLLEIRDETVPEYIEKLDFMAATLIAEVNKAHFQGYGLDGSTGNYFFQPNNISIEAANTNTGGASIFDAIITDPSQLMASNFEVRFVTGAPQDSKYEIYDELNDEYLFIMDAGNSSLVFEEDGTQKLITIDPGTYTGKELAAEIEKKLDEAATNTAAIHMDYSVSYNADERAFTFKNLGDNSSNLLFSSPDTTIAEILGFNEALVPLAPIETVSSDVKSGIYNYAAQLIEINNSNNQLEFEILDLSGEVFTAKLTAGAYTPDELAAEIENQFIEESGSSFNVNFDRLEQSFTITNNTGFGVDYNFSSSSSSAASTLNFNSGNVSVGIGLDLSSDPRHAERQFNIIKGTNDEIAFNDEGLGGDITAVIPEGKYTGEELAAEIEKQMEATKGSSGQDYIVTFDTTNGSFQIINKSDNLHNLSIDWTSSPGAALTLGFSGVDNLTTVAGANSVTGGSATGDVVSYDSIEIYGMLFKIADKTSSPVRGDVFKISTIKGASGYVAMDEVTASDMDKISAALSVIDIDGSNNTIIYDDDGDLSDNRDADGNLVVGNYKKIVIPSGRYTPEELAAEIEKLLEENSANDSYAVEFDRDTHKFSFISNPSNTNTVTFLWEAEETTADFSLGFSTDIFTITENVNNQLDFQEGTLPGVSITLTPGSYTGEKMATEIQDKMNESLSQYYEVSYEDETRSFTFSNTDDDNTLNVDLDWTASNVTENTAVTLGFNSVVTDIDLGTSAVSDYTPGSIDPSGLTSVSSNTSDFSVGEAQVGDNRNAINITDIRDQKILENNSLTLDSFYNILTSEVGSKVNETSRGAEHQNYMVAQYEERRSSISGVSIDEEMISLIKYQQSYAVSAKLISTLDQMLDILVSLR